MKRKILCSVLLFVWACLCVLPAHAEKPRVSVYWEYLLEKPTWGMIEWSSATLPKGFWYPTFEFLYVYNGSYFVSGKENDYPGGRDSTNYLVTGRLLYGLTNKLTVGAYVPIVLDQKVDSGKYVTTTNIISGASNVGDIQLFLKYWIADRYFWSLATEAGLTFATGKPYNKVSAKQAGTGDGQTDLNFTLLGDVLLTEEAFLKLGTGFSMQLKREFRPDTALCSRYNWDECGSVVEEKLGDMFWMEGGVVRNFKRVGLSGTLRYTYWGPNKWNNEVILDHADRFDFSFRLSLGEPKPRKHAKLDLFLEFPLTGTNSPLTYRIGAGIKAIFK